MSTHTFQKHAGTGLADLTAPQINLQSTGSIDFRSGFPRPTCSLLATVLLICSATSFQVIAHESHGSVSPDGRFTPNVDGAVFPPQPRDVSNVRVHTPSISLGASAQVRGAGTPDVEAARAAQRHADVQVLLGDRYSMLQSARVRDKAARNKKVFHVEYFSRSENRTVIAKSVNGVITEVNSYAASERQPPLGEEEKALAINIARQYWVDQDDPRVGELAGYAIQTFQPDGSPYASRVAYVSFHAQSPEPPELFTWVDLSEENVFRAEVAR
ncbi:MAG: hypothetical protein AB8B64_18955 [Granulosicoccus sp.]